MPAMVTSFLYDQKLMLAMVTNFKKSKGFWFNSGAHSGKVNMSSGTAKGGVATPEIVKCGFWRKLPLFYHFCAAPTPMMKISDFPIYSFTNDLLSQFIRFGLYEMSQLRAVRPIGYFIIPTIYYNIHNLLYDCHFHGLSS